MAGRIGGPDLAAHPELFQDYNGNTIKGMLPGIAAFLETNAQLPYEEENTAELDLGL